MIRSLLLAFATILGTSTSADSVRLAVTTSFQNSGLADVLLPEIKADTGIDVQLLVVGTGQAIRLGEAGDVDILLVHARSAEDAFVAEGFGTHRREIMYNDFVLIGPETDPAGISSSENAIEALARIRTSEALFISRGDDSGTHKMELALWSLLDPPLETPGRWYRSVGAGMGAALNMAAAEDAYILSDRASWLNFQNKGRLAILFAGDPRLFNQYTLLPVNPDKHTHVNAALTETLENWLTSARAETLINGYQISGQTLFTFNANDT